MPKSSNYEIKTTLAVDGEKKFKAAMEDANRAMRVSDSEVKKLKAAYAAGGSEMDYYTGRARVLNKEAEQQEAIVEALRKAVGEAAEKYGYASKQVEGYKIQLNNAEAKQIQLAKAAQQANRDLEKLGRDGPKIGRQISRGIGDAAEETSEKVESMFEGLQKEINAIRSNTTVSAFVDIGGAISGAVSNLDAFAESSREYRRSMSFLEQNAGLYGLEFAEIKELFFEMASITGEVDSSVEALSNLMASGFDSSEMAAAVDLLGGAVTRFPDTLKFESLADGLQETLATKEATGQYAELLERLGINLEEFNKELGEAKTAEEQQEIALAYLTKNGLATAYQMYKDTNGELMAAEEATLRLNDALSGFGEIIDKVTAPGKLFVADVLSGFVTLATEGAEAAYGMSDADFWKEFGKKSGSYRGENKKAIFQTDFGQAFKNIGEGLLDFLIPSAGAEELPTTDLQDYGFKAAQEVATGMMQGMEGNAAVDAAMKTAIAEMDAKDVMDSARTAGKNLMIEFGNGIAEGTSIPINNVANMVNQINAMLSRISAPAFGLGWSGITGGNIYLYNQQRNNARNVSKMIGSGVISTTLSKK